MEWAAMMMIESKREGGRCNFSTQLLYNSHPRPPAHQIKCNIPEPLLVDVVGRGEQRTEQEWLWRTDEPSE